ncbi:hypothetical protein [Janthinobacterium sp. JC611]|uniref:hypothetical protein n=1 Tax=Janthinobacterium sp. JC611 TaxID=2816201 RepID=UPI001BFDD74F|nr:hypothetical protein [Janthinobacterium sp. JC611]
MSTHDQDHDEPNDEELNALLASLPQPAPSSALDAAILADAKKALQQPAAANDSADGVLRTLPAKKSPDYLQRWRVPLGLAAAVLLTVNLIGVDWFGSKPAQFPVVGEPVTQEVMPAAPAPRTMAVAKPALAPATDTHQAPAQRALAMPAPVAAKPAPLPSPAKLDASVWLVKIDALLKAGESTLAQEEWTAFRHAYPDYPVAEELRQRLEKK